MPTSPFERSRAAVAVSCLEWLRCKGPAVAPGPARVPERAVVGLLRDDPMAADPRPAPARHPLWDRWIDD